MSPPGIPRERGAERPGPLPPRLRQKAQLRRSEAASIDRCPSDVRLRTHRRNPPPSSRLHPPSSRLPTSCLPHPGLRRRRASEPARTSEVVHPECLCSAASPKGRCVGRCLLSTSAITTVPEHDRGSTNSPCASPGVAPLRGVVRAAEHARCTAGREVTVQEPIGANTRGVASSALLLAISRGGSFIPNRLSRTPLVASPCPYRLEGRYGIMERSSHEPAGSRRLSALSARGLPSRIFAKRHEKDAP